MTTGQHGAPTLPSGGQPSPDTAPGRRRATRSGVVVGLLLVLGVLADVAARVLVERGYVDRDLELVRIGSAVLLGAAAALGSDMALVRWTDFGTAARAGVAALVLLVVGGVVWFLRSGGVDQEYQTGTISSAEPWAHRPLLTGGNGYRYYISLDRHPDSMRARMELRGAGIPIEAELQDDGSLVAEGVLPGDATWTALIQLIEGEGRYMLYVDSTPPTPLTVPHAERATRFEDGRTSAAFIFTTEDTGWATIDVESRGDPAPETPGLYVRDSRGRLWASSPAAVDDPVRTELPAGVYVIEVRGEAGQAFALELTVADSVGPAPGGQPGIEPQPSPDPVDPVDPGPAPGPGVVEPTLVAVPDVARAPAPDAERALAEAGFVVETIPVCSTSFAAADAAVGDTRQVVLAGATSVETEVEVVGADGVTMSELPAGSALVVKSFSGVPCG